MLQVIEVVAYSHCLRPQHRVSEHEQSLKDYGVLEIEIPQRKKKTTTNYLLMNHSYRLCSSVNLMSPHSSEL